MIGGLVLFGSSISPFGRFELSAYPYERSPVFKELIMETCRRILERIGQVYACLPDPPDTLKPFIFSKGGPPSQVTQDTMDGEYNNDHDFTLSSRSNPVFPRKSRQAEAAHAFAGRSASNKSGVSLRSLRKESRKDLESESLQTLGSETSSKLPAGTRSMLFTDVLPYYTQLLRDLESAQDAISMLYYAFDYGEWSTRISTVLIARAQAGVHVRLMIDGFGLVLEEPRHSQKNLLLIQRLRAGGVTVDVFNPYGSRLTFINRLHIKLCAIDDHIAYVGGSNIADHYLTWDDTNLRLQGQSVGSFHDVYNEALNLSSSKSSSHKEPPKNMLDNAAIRLTIPNRKKEIRVALMKLIEDADRTIYIRTWYFFPDRQIMQALIRKARSGVDVHILLSHRTRVRPIDFMNRYLCRRIVKAGGKIYRYTEKYMHAKVAWNNKGDILLGSANIEYTGMNTNFECCLSLHDLGLMDQLQKRFLDDACGCLRPHAQTAERADKERPDKVRNRISGLRWLGQMGAIL
jgi:cardiolipin synthase